MSWEHTGSPPLLQIPPVAQVMPGLRIFLIMDHRFSRRDFLGRTASSIFGAAIIDDGDRIKRWLEAIYDTAEPAPPPVVPTPETWSDQDVTACWIGHSTVLLNLFGVHVLTDPVFRGRVGMDVAGLFTLGPKRLVAPALPAEYLPRIDLILISHGHMDHCDPGTLELLPRDSLIVVPRGTADIVTPVGFREVRELGWNERFSLGDLQIEALPAAHSGARYPWLEGPDDGTHDPGFSNAYLLTSHGISILFAGDTAFSHALDPLRDRETPVTLAILPIGGYIPHPDNHCSPEEALSMADGMGAQQIFPIHWGTFPGEEGLNEPIERLRNALGGRTERIAVEQIGGTWCLHSEGMP